MSSSTGERKCGALRRLGVARVHRPYTLAIASVVPIPGVLAIIYGDATSQALSNLAAGVVSRVIGVALLVGAALTLVGVARGRSLIEAAGLLTIAFGTGVYGLGVLLGLGLGGAIAGPFALAIAAGSVLRVIGLAATAHEVSKVE